MDLNFPMFIILNYLADVLLPLILSFLFHQNILIDKNIVTYILQDKNLVKALNSLFWYTIDFKFAEDLKPLKTMSLFA